LFSPEITKNTKKIENGVPSPTDKIERYCQKIAICHEITLVNEIEIEGI